MIYTDEDIKNMTSINLASMVVIYRILGSYKDEAKMAMIELMQRQATGDAFDFEKFIDEKSIEHAINVNIPSFASVKAKMSNAVFQALLEIKKEGPNKNNNDLSDIISDDDDDDEGEE